MKRILLLTSITLGASLIICTPTRAELKFVKADSEETSGEEGQGARAFDGQADTIWHTQWQDSSPECPHEIVFQVDPPAKIKGLTYLPRQDESENGTIKGFDIYVSVDGKTFDKLVKKGTFAAGKEKKTATFPLVEVGFVKLVATSEVGGNPWTSAAEIGVVGENDAVDVVPSLSVVSADSEETSGEDGHASNAVDGNPETKWHTQWESDSPACPHEIVLKLDNPSVIAGLTYLPRQDEGDNGGIKDYEVYVSDDGKTWGEPVAKGTFENAKEKKTATFAARTAAFIKLRALSEVNDNAWTSAAEIGVVPPAK